MTKHHYFLLYIIYLKLMLTSCFQIEAVQKEVIAEKDSTVTLKWSVLSDLQDANKPIECSFAESNKPTFVYGTAEGDSTFSFTVTYEGRSIFGQRIRVSLVENATELKTTFAITINKVHVTDENIYECTYGNQASRTKLYVIQKLTILRPGFPKQVHATLNNVTNITVQICGEPKPVVIWTYLGRQVKSLGKENNWQCYDYTYELNKPSGCGKTLAYNVTSLNQSINGEIKIKTNLEAKSPDNVIMIKDKSSKCIKVTWSGPNIGFCVTSLFYEIAVLNDGKTLKTFSTSSNLVHICLHDVFSISSRSIIRVRTVINNSTSSWITASIYAENTIRDVIIITTIISLALTTSLLLVLYWYYKRKVKNLKRKSTRKSVSDDEGSNIRYTSLDDLNEPEKEGNVLYGALKEKKTASNENSDALYEAPKELEPSLNVTIQTDDQEVKNFKQQTQKENETSNDGKEQQEISNNGLISRGTKVRSKEKNYFSLLKPFGRALSETAAPLEEDYATLDRRKLKHSISLDHYDVINKDSTLSTTNDVNDSLLHREIKDLNAHGNEKNKTRLTEKKQLESVYDVIPCRKTNGADNENMRGSIGLDNLSPNIYEDGEALYDVPKFSFSNIRL